MKWIVHVLERDTSIKKVHLLDKSNCHVVTRKYISKKNLRTKLVLLPVREKKIFPV